MTHNKNLVDASKVPQLRAELMKLLTSDAGELKGKGLRRNGCLYWCVRSTSSEGPKYLFRKSVERGRFGHPRRRRWAVLRNVVEHFTRLCSGSVYRHDGNS